MTGTTIIAVDTETTSLRPDRRIWEIGFIVRRPGESDSEFRWFIDLADLDLGNADLISLKIGGFYDRHPQMISDREDPDPQHGRVIREHNAMAAFEQHSRGAHLVGNVVSFDADVIGQRMRAHGICPSWHYHLIDCEALAVGYLAGVADGEKWSGDDPRMLGDLPWDSDRLSAALNVKLPADQRHTALGDAAWALAIYDAVMGS
jgi:hypothetical protein